jgi:hypothetical protein
MAAKGGNELLGRFRRNHQRLEEGFPVGAGQHHPFVLVQHPARALIGAVARRQAGDGHRPLDQFLGRGADAQLDPFAFDFAGRFPTVRGCSHSVLLPD